MRVIHFTHGATDPLHRFRATGAHFVPLADGSGDTHVSCLHLEKGGRITAPSISQAATLLIVHGRITIIALGEARINFYAGMGAVFQRHEPDTLEADTAAIAIFVKTAELTADACGISTPQRIAGATWPCDSVIA